MQFDLRSWISFIKTKKQPDGQTRAWDEIRSKWLVLTPEEMVRLSFIQYLINHFGISKNRIAVEKSIQVGKKFKRFDILIYDQKTIPYLAIECKSPDVKLDSSVMEQLVRYNQTLDASYLCITNGMEYLVFVKNMEKKWVLLKDSVFFQ